MKRVKIDNRTTLWAYVPFVCGSLALTWQALFFYAPLICVLIMSFAGETIFSGFVPFFSSIYAAVLLRSVVMALLTAIVCLIIGYPLAYFLVFRAGRLKNMFLFLIILPFWTNFLLHICAWFFVLDRNGLISLSLVRLGLISSPLNLINSYWAIGIVMVYFYLPFMILPLYAALDRFDKRLLDASLDLGATWIQTVARILLPLTMAGMRVGFLLVCIPAFGEFVIPYFMGGDRSMFAGSVITHFILRTESGVEGASFTLLSSLVLVLVAGLVYGIMGYFIPKGYEGEEKEW